MAAFPDFNALPGAMAPGAAWPGTPPPAGGGGGGLAAIFTGSETFTYPQYLDTQTQKTLVARPGGGEYSITIASGYVNVGPLPDDGRWIAQ